MKSFVLLIAVLTSTTGAVEVIYAKVGDRVKLNPPEVKDLHNSYMHWKLTKDGSSYLAWRNSMGKTEIVNPWNNTLSWSGDSLLIKSIQQDHFRTFFLQLKIGFKEPTFFEYQIRKLTVTVDPSSPLLPEESVSLSCSDDTPQSERKIHWLKPGGKKEYQLQFTFKASVLDNGQWSCVVTSDGKESRSNVSVTVLDLSPALPHPQYTSKSWPLLVPCSLLPHVSWEQIKAKGFRELHWHFIPATGSSRQRLFSLSVGDPLTWKKDQGKTLLPNSDPQKGNLSLSRKLGTEGDAGEYICALEFENGVTLQRSVHVQLLQIVPSPGKELISGQPLNLTCTLGQPLSINLHLKWFPPKQSTLLTSAFHNSSHLIIPAVGREDEGSWRCELWWKNDKLLTRAEITLKIEPWLSVWMLVVICSVTIIVILVVILLFILFRRRQKMRHLRRRLCQCKHPKPKGFYRT
ncbi:CD4-1 molecule isoform X2 [Eleginops maclovinus]|uniref:CD4-1 molecule isoform X2 n=1 Tax=Eleginops maclovinus TaxID=56733 RepID=UPI0030809BBB